MGGENAAPSKAIFGSSQNTPTSLKTDTMKWLLPLAITICSLSFVSCNKGDEVVPSQTLTPTTQEPNEWEKTPEIKNNKPVIKPKHEGESTKGNE